MRTQVPARTRLLEAATRLFYADGVHAVGIDRIIAEAGVAKASFYNHFPSKDDLVRAYVEEQSELQRAVATSVAETAQGDAAIRDYFDLLGEAGTSPSYRGCPIVNVAIEYPDPAHAIRAAIAEHRRWFRDHFRGLLTAADHPESDRTADILVLLRDGLLVGLDLDDSSAVRAATRAAVTRTLAASPGLDQPRLRGGRDG